tara:strand:+ start:369 stop:593 length:225 start_codon:yes stop_codon:yes gene_type:complete
MYHPNLLLMVNKSKNMEVNEMIKPNMINGLDLTFSSSTLGLILDDTKLLSFLEKSLGKGLITMKFTFKLIILKF